MSRWTYLIPRLIILALILLALWVGNEPLMRSALVHQIESATGAKVDVGQLRYNWSNHKLFIKDMMVADPRDPMRNLLQVDMAYMQIAPEPLLRRRIVVTEGQTSRIMFGTPRMSLGVLPDLPTPEPGPPFKMQTLAQQSVNSISQRWLDQLDPAESGQTDTDALNLVRTADQLETYWQEQLALLTPEVRRIQDATAKCLTASQQDDGNPLRDRWRENWHLDVEHVKSDSQATFDHIRELTDRLVQNSKQLDAAELLDAETIRQSIKTTSFQADDMSHLLLDQLHAEYVDQIVDLFRWFQHAMPDPAQAFAPKRKRGIDLPMPGLSSKPQFLIDQIELNGEGRFLNQQFQFSGHAYNLTPQPELIDQPARFELHAQGNQHVIVNCEMDRRQSTPIDSMNIVCPELEIEGRQLGESNSLLVTMGPAGRVQAEVKLTATGDQLNGEIILRHTNMSFHVDNLNELAGGETTALHMNQGLALVNQFDSRINVTGQLHKYQFSATSDLGRQFAAAANSLLTENKQKEIQRRTSALKAMKAIQAKKLLDWKMQLEQLVEQLADQRTRIANLSTQIEQAKPGLRNRFR